MPDFMWTNDRIFYSAGRETLAQPDAAGKTPSSIKPEHGEGLESLIRRLTVLVADRGHGSV